MSPKRGAKKAAAPPPPPAESFDETGSDDSEDEEAIADSPVPTASTPTLKNLPAPSQKGDESESSDDEEDDDEDDDDDDDDYEEEDEPVRAASKNQPPPPQKEDASDTSGDEEEDDDDEEEELTRAAPPSAPTKQPPLPQEKEDSDTSGDEDESDEEEAPPPPQKEEDSDTSGDEEDDDEEEEEEPTRAAPPTAPTKQPPQPQEKEDSDTSGDEGESDEEEAPPPKPAPKKDAEALKPPAAAETKKPGAVQRIWSTDDEVRILEAIAAHQNQHGTFPQPEALIHVLDGKLDNPAYGSKELQTKIKSLRHRYLTLSRKGELPSKEHDRRILHLSKLVWTGDKITAPAAATANNVQEQKGFEEMCELYPCLAEEVKAVEAVHPGMCKRAFGKMDDDMAHAMDEKIKRQRVVQIKLEMRCDDLAKEVTKALVDLFDG